jgi:hypothetical protein
MVAGGILAQCALKNIFDELAFAGGMQLGLARALRSKMAVNLRLLRGV